MEFENFINFEYNAYSKRETNKIGSDITRWNRIIILDHNQNPIKDKIYQLDSKERLIKKLKRQRRRDLGKVTGKKKVPKNWKQIVENLDETGIATSNVLNDSIVINNESQFSSSSSDQETQQLDLISIDWLLNQPAPLSTVC